MKNPEHIVLEDVSNWCQNDINLVKLAYQIDTIEEIIELWTNDSLVRIADTLDFEYAYEDYIKSNDKLSYITYGEFLKEINKGYGNSGTVEIARLLILSNGIYYDNDFC